MFSSFSFFFFFNDTATTEIYTLSLHDALPISLLAYGQAGFHQRPPSTTDCAPVDGAPGCPRAKSSPAQDRKSTRLNSSHLVISYAVFCLKKKKKKNNTHTSTQ